MNDSLVTGLAAVLGSLTGASAAITTTWITERGRARREQAMTETVKRESLYGEFLIETTRLIADALDHSLERPDTFVKLWGCLARIRLLASEPVVAAALEVV